ncbi:MAG: hypothetical protein LBM16_00730 [Clostridiales bacterium]|jgi:TrmH family RNA methyltransferase|nr:hypothetical protein [Clostridiales bacterium]
MSDLTDFNQIIDKYERKIRLAGKQNPVVRHAKSLLSNTKPNPRRFIVIEGIWAFNMAERAGIRVINFIAAPECIYSPDALALAEKFAMLAEDINIVSKKVFCSLSERDEPDGLMAVCLFPDWSLDSIKTENAVVMVLDGLEIPGNIGTIIRSADAAAADAIFVCNRKARLTNPKLVKGSMGAIFFKPIIEFETPDECKNYLMNNNYNIYLTDTRAEKNYKEYDYSGNTAIIIGSERYGISRGWYDDKVKLLSVPMLGVCDSLNVAIAATVVLYEARMKKSGKF